jgi:hypothetical protein
MELLTLSLIVATYSQLGNNFVTLERILAVEDSFQQWRIAIWFSARNAGFFSTLRSVHASAQEKVDEILKHFVTVIKTQPLAAGFLHSTRLEWKHSLLGIVQDCIHYHRRKQSDPAQLQILEGLETFFELFCSEEPGVPMKWSPVDLDKFEFQRVQAVSVP